MSMPVLSSRATTPKVDKERAKRQAARDQVPAIPPELLMQRDNKIRYERNGPVYATDGKVGVLKKVVVDESAGEVVELVVQAHDGSKLILIPPDVVDRSAGSALFLTINHLQFLERGMSGTSYVKQHFSKVDVKSLGKSNARQSANPRRVVSSIGADFVETPTSSPLERLQRRTQAVAAD